MKILILALLAILVSACTPGLVVEITKPNGTKVVVRSNKEYTKYTLDYSEDKDGVKTFNFAPEGVKNSQNEAKLIELGGKLADKLPGG